MGLGHEELEKIAQKLIKGVDGGRVNHTDFLEPDDAAMLNARLSDNASISLDGGFSGASRRVLTAFPEHIPNASTELVTVYFADGSVDKLRDLLFSKSISPNHIGDVVPHFDGSAAVLLATETETLQSLSELSIIDAGDIRQGKTREELIIAPALRVDALGAKAFKVSRSYFSKGIQNGKVFVNGKVVGKAATVEVGDEVFADGLGRYQVVEVRGETKKGNQKVLLNVEMSPKSKG